MALMVLVVVVIIFKLDPLGLWGASVRGSAHELAARRYDPSARVEQVAISPEYRDGEIHVALSEIDTASIVRFEVPDKRITLPNGTSFDSLPVTIYVASSGKVVAAISLCEPCSGSTFHIRGTRLVCNACATLWSLETLKGIAGGCMDYPPDQVAYTVADGKLVLDENELRSWIPRD